MIIIRKITVALILIFAMSQFGETTIVMAKPAIPSTASNTSTLSIVSLTPSVPSPQNLGATVQWNCIAKGRSLEYSFAILKEGNILSQTDYSKSAIYEWTPNEPGTDYQIAVYVKDRTNNTMSLTSEAFTICNNNDSESATQNAEFYIYYGPTSDNVIEKLGHYSVAIIEPRHWERQQVSALQAKGTKVVGYISVIEQNVATDVYQKSFPEDFYYRNGEKVHRSEHNSYVMDICSEHYRELLLNDFKNEIVDKGLDGVFLDTLDDLESSSLVEPDDASVQIPIVTETIGSMKSMNPGVLVIQNRGMHEVIDWTHNYIDCVLWEDFDPYVVPGSGWCQNIASRLAAYGSLKVYASIITTNDDTISAFYNLCSDYGYWGMTFADGYDSI